MPLFGEQTTEEIKQRLAGKTTKELIQLKKEYKTYLDQLNKRHEETLASLNQCSKSLSAHEVLLTTLKAKEPGIHEEEAQRMAALQDLEPSVDNYIVRSQLLSYSPRQAYINEINALSESIDGLKSKKSELKIKISAINLAVKAELREYRTLELILKQKQADCTFDNIEVTSGAVSRVRYPV